jgi:hypothetical protein
MADSPAGEEGIMVKRLGLSRAITLGGAFIMLVAGIALCRFSGTKGATAMPQAEQRASSSRLPQPAPVGAAFLPRRPPAPEAEKPGAVRPGTASTEKAAASQSPASAAAPVRTQAGRERQPEAAPRYPLPPFPPPDFAPAGAAEASTGPAPGVLWLSGVIQGNPKVALLRRGEKRYLMKEGGTFESYRVVKIGPNSVTIQRGSRKQTLRVGQY